MSSLTDKLSTRAPFPLKHPKESVNFLKKVKKYDPETGKLLSEYDRRLREYRRSQSQ